jgi:hypothetical protein
LNLKKRVYICLLKNQAKMGTYRRKKEGGRVVIGFKNDVSPVGYQAIGDLRRQGEGGGSKNWKNGAMSFMDGP